MRGWYLLAVGVIVLSPVFASSTANLLFSTSLTSLDQQPTVNSRGGPEDTASLGVSDAPTVGARLAHPTPVPSGIKRETLTAAKGAWSANPPPDNVQDFIRRFLPLAQAQYREYGIPVGVQLAVAGYEGGCDADEYWPLDPPRNNWFNITVAAGDPYATGSYWCGAQEFRTYPSAEGAWKAFGHLITDDPNYREFLSDLPVPARFLERFYPVYCNCSDFEDLLEIYHDWMSVFDN